MEAFKKEVIAKLPSMLEQHFKEMRETNPELTVLFSNHYDYIKTSLEKYFLRLVTSIFDDEQYEKHKEETEIFSFEIGKDFIQQVQMDIDPEEILDLNQNLYEHIFIVIYQLFEEGELERSVKMKLTRKLHELTWLSSHSFLRGYLLSKEQEIDRLHQQKLLIMGQMAAGMAHEIRNPITSVNGFIQLLKEKNEQGQHDPTLWDHYLSICLTEMASIEKLVTDFLILSKKNQYGTDAIQAYDFNLILKRIEPFFRFYAMQKKIALHIDAPDGEILTLINPQYMEQICLNIIKNAIDAVSNDGNVWLSCSFDPSDNEWVIQCADDGCGIPPDALNNIFDPFFTTKHSGAGLGLPICKNLLEAMNGKIRVFSEAEKGSTVQIRVPAAVRDDKD